MLSGLFRLSVVYLVLVAGSIFGGVTGTVCLAAAPSLPSYNADIAQTSISGISSGAFMAVQFGTAWSSIIKGVGAIAGGPFGCSGGLGATALSSCMGGSPTIDLQALFERTDAWSRSGAIDDIGLLAGEKIYLFNGYNDSVVARTVSNALSAFYGHYLPSTANTSTDATMTRLGSFYSTSMAC
jgi:hypothetical protein